MIASCIQDYQARLDEVIDDLISVGVGACEQDSTHAEVVVRMLSELKQMRDMMPIMLNPANHTEDGPKVGASGERAIRVKV